MTMTARLSHSPTLRRTAVALAMTAFAGASFALPVFTMDPAAAGLAGTSFTADNIIISDYSTIRFDGAGGFTDTGFLDISAMQLVGSTLIPTGLNSTYGLYIKFDGAGTTTVGNPAAVATNGTFTSLNYTLYGYNGSASFGFDGANNPTETASAEVALATGTLVSGTAGTVPNGGGKFTPSASATLTFTPSLAAFFTSPDPFFNQSFAAFTNTITQVEAFSGGFKIRQGGGAFNFATAVVPEPESYALMLAGLATIGFLARRRRV
jgi:hypothetical protein